MRVIQLGIALLIALGVQAEQRVVNVSNYGQDFPQCGDSGRPCRSIGQAVRNASDGDTVLVAPGLYGDLNRNASIGDLGEESDTSGCACLIDIDKRITVLSERGAATTVIDARGTSLVAVRMTAAGAAFGFEGQGFTVLGGAADAIEGLSPDAVFVQGNRVRGGLTGIQLIVGDVRGNEVTDTTGFVGIEVGVGRVSDNVVARNNFGIHVHEGAVEGNVVSDNNGPGAYITDYSNTAIVRNVFIRNRGPGVSFPFPRQEHFVGIYSNDFIGNDPVGSCAIENRSGGEVWAGRNFFAGAADFEVFNQFVCDSLGGTTHLGDRKVQPHR